MYNNVPDEELKALSKKNAIDAIEFITEREVGYSREGDPDELGKILINFLKSTHEKSIDGLETYLYVSKICSRKCKVKGINIENMVRISYRYHIYIDMYRGRVDNIILDSIFSENKLRNIFPDFFKYIKEKK